MRIPAAAATDRRPCRPWHRPAALLVAIVALLVVAPASPAVASSLGPGGARQEILVIGSYGSPAARLETYQFRAGAWHRVLSTTARIGRNGLREHKREGDGATPVGTFTIGRTMYGNSTTVPSHRYAYHHLRCGDWWDGNLNSSRYNTFRHLACGARGPGGGSEALWRMTRAYQHVAVINYNMDPVTPGRGSAIFLHDFTSLPSTSGCVSIAPSVLDKVLAWLDPAQHPVIRIGTSKEVHAPR